LQIKKLFFPESLELAVMYNNVGNVYQVSHNVEKALEFYQTAIQITQGLGICASVLNFYNNVGVAYQQKKQYKKSLYWYNRILAFIADKLKRENLAGWAIPEIAQLYNNMGVAYYSLSSLRAALAAYQKALEV